MLSNGTIQRKLVWGINHPLESTMIHTWPRENFRMVDPHRDTAQTLRPNKFPLRRGGRLSRRRRLIIVSWPNSGRSTFENDTVLRNTLECGAPGYRGTLREG